MHRESPTFDRLSGLEDEESSQDSPISDRLSEVKGRLRLPSPRRGSANPSDGENTSYERKEETGGDSPKRPPFAKRGSYVAI